VTLIASVTGTAMITPTTPNNKALDRKQNMISTGAAAAPGASGAAHG
jgi:hypothetical protein